MLKPVEAVDVEIVSYQEENDLHPNRPVRHKIQSCKSCSMIDPNNNGLNQNSENVALNDCVEKQIIPKSASKEWLSAIIRNRAFKNNDNCCAQQDKECGAHREGHRHSVATLMLGQRWTPLCAIFSFEPTRFHKRV